MRRRQFLHILGSAAATWPVVARAQQSAMPVIGFVNGQSAKNFEHLVAAFREGLSEIGYVEVRNVAIEYRWAEGQLERVSALAAELIRRQVAVIAATGGADTAVAAATSTIPIVGILGGDPIKDGLVASLNKPGGNVTGVTVFSTDTESKRLELVHELAPKDALIGVIIDSEYRGADDQVREVQSAARALLRQILVLHVRTEADIDVAFAKLREAKAAAVSIAAGPYNNSRRGRFVERAAEYALPTIYENRETARTGGLMSYGTSLPNVYRQVGIYTGRILKGERPSDLPVMQP